MIKINGEYWDIVFVNPCDDILLNYDGIYTLGVTVPEYRTIFIADDISGDLLHAVLSHELTHAQIASRGLYVPEYVEEVLADWISDNTLEIADTSNCIHNDWCEYYHKC